MNFLPPQTTSFLQEFFADGDVILLRFFPKEEGSAPSSYWATSLAQVEELVRDHDYHQNHHVYFGVNPRTNMGVNTVEEQRWFCVDIDVKKVKSKKKALSIVEDFLLPPTFIVDSGHGIHAYWKLRTPVQPDPSIQRTHQLFEQALSSDPIHDPTRIMRLPGTFNVKTESKVLCRVLQQSPYSWSPAALLNALQLRPSVYHAVREGNLDLWNGDRSRADFSVAVQCFQVGIPREDVENLFAWLFKASKFHGLSAVEADKYLKLTLDEASQKKEESLYHDNVLGLYEDANRVFSLQGQEGKILTTFTFTPQHLLAVGEFEQATRELFWVGELTTSQQHWQNVLLPLDAFSSRVSLNKALSKEASWSFFGTDTDAVRLKEFIRLKAPALETRKAVKEVGRHHTRWCWGSHVSISDDPKEVVYLPDETLLSSFPLDYSRKPQPSDMERILRGLSSLNRPAVVQPVLGWFSSTPYKSLLEERGYPILNLYGTMGCGKSSLAGLLLRLFGYTEARLWSTIRQTPFSLMKLASFSHSVPLAMDEYRLSEMNTDKRAQVQDFFIESYISTTTARGRPDQSLLLYKARSPLVVLGEERMETPEALTERIVQVSLRREDISVGTSYYQQYQSLLGVDDLTSFASEYIPFTLTYDLPLEKASHFVEQDMKPYVTIHAERVRRNLLLTVAGYMTLSAFARSRYKVELASLSPAAFAETVTSVYSQTGGVNRPADRFLTDILNWIGSGNEQAVQFIPCRLDTEDSNRLWVSRKAAYEYWMKHTVSKDLTSFSALSDQLSELEASNNIIIHANQVRSIRSSSQNAMCIDIVQANKRYQTPMDFSVDTITITRTSY